MKIIDKVDNLIFLQNKMYKTVLSFVMIGSVIESVFVGHKKSGQHGAAQFT